MKSLVLVLLTFAVSMGLAATPFDGIFSALMGGEVEREAARTRLVAMPKDELGRFMNEAKARVETKNRLQVVRAFDVLRRRPDFDSATARQMQQILKTGPKAELLEERLALILDARSGALTTDKIQSELQFTANTSQPSARRLARVTALTDAMQENGMKPSTAQLEALLQNDVYEIRMHAVDWFRLAPPADVKDRGRFLKLALSSKVIQVRERAFRTVASWAPSDVQALKKGDVLPAKCAADPSQVIRDACADIREKAKQP